MTGLTTLHLSDAVTLHSNLSNKLPEVCYAIERNITQMAMRPFEEVFNKEVGIDDLPAEEFVLLGAVISERIDHVLWLLKRDVIQCYSKYWSLPILKIMYPNEGLQEKIICRHDRGKFRISVEEDVVVLGEIVTTFVEVGSTCYQQQPSAEYVDMYAAIGRMYIRQLINKRHELDFTYEEESE